MQFISIATLAEWKIPKALVGEWMQQYDMQNGHMDVLKIWIRSDGQIASELGFGQIRYLGGGQYTLAGPGYNCIIEFSSIDKSANELNVQLVRDDRCPIQTGKISKYQVVTPDTEESGIGPAMGRLWRRMFQAAQPESHAEPIRGSGIR